MFFPKDEILVSIRDLTFFRGGRRIFDGVKCSDPDGDAIPEYVERDFRQYLSCGILANGFARARCDHCGHDFLVAFSCKGRGVCPSCNTRRMAETAAHLVDHVFPQVPVRQWVLSLPKRLRYFLHHHANLLKPVLQIFLAEVEVALRSCSPDVPDGARLGAVTFVHRFGAGAQCQSALPLLCHRRSVQHSRRGNTVSPRVPN